MPNWCSNTIHLDGKKEHRQEFVDKNKGFRVWDTTKKEEYYDLSFNASVKMPNSIRDKHKRNIRNDEWYGWCNKNWGTKWEAQDTNLEHTDDYTYYSFETAWGFPEAWLIRVSRIYPHIKFNVEWAEEGGCGGRFMMQGGECFYTHNKSSKEWRDYMGYEDNEDDF